MVEIGEPNVSTLEAGGTSVSCDIEIGGRRRQLWYRASVPLAAVGVEPFVCVAQVPAMSEGQDVSTSTPVSARLAAALPQAQARLAGWHAHLRPVALRAPTHVLSPANSNANADGEANGDSDARGVGCFFSGGVDSFYSVLRHAGEVDTLIFVHGFDVPLAAADLRGRVARELRAAAASLGKRLVEVETNAREFLDGYGNWGLHTHGTALASVAHLLAGTVRKVYIAASESQGEASPWGSHPMLDPLWSSECVEVVYDADRASRLDKTFAIARCDATLAHLRVCWENPDGAYNCGRCEKCLRTMMGLALAGALPACRTFDGPPDLGRVERMHVTQPSRRRLYADLAAAARRVGNEPIARAAERALAPPPKRGWLRRQAGRIRRKVLGR